VLGQGIGHAPCIVLPVKSVPDCLLKEYGAHRAARMRDGAVLDGSISLVRCCLRVPPSKTVYPLACRYALRAERS
jgi:hypothetical protein